MTFVVPLPPVAALSVVGSSELFPVGRIFCIGRNYAEHAREMGQDPDRDPPFFFMKPASALVAEGRPFPYPAASADVHYELELVVALGRGGTGIRTNDALEHVYGYAVGLDMTRRDLQTEAKKMGRPWEVGRAFDNSAPCSRISPASRIGHPADAAIWLDLNNKRVQDSNISQLIWSIPEILEQLSKLFTLAAGDLIYTGTPAGVGPVHRGDLLHGGVDSVGELTVQVV